MSTTAKRKENLYKISDLARETGVPTGTIKFYLRAGLLPAPTLKTGRNMAYYDRRFVDRIRTIKELQQKRFLPLEVIKAILDRDTSVISQREVDTLLELEGTFYEAVHYAPGHPPVRCDQVEELYGIEPEHVALCVELGVFSPVERDGVEYFEGEDVLLLENFRSLRATGLGSELVPREHSLPLYVDAIGKLAREELKMFSRAVTGRVDDARLAEMALAGIRVVEQFIVLLRRKLLLRAIHELRQEARSEAIEGSGEEAVANVER
jgi:DNA-binding transcriptional MerR regulator